MVAVCKLPIPGMEQIDVAEAEIITMIGKLQNPIPGVAPIDGSQRVPSAYYDGEFLTSGIDFLLSKASQWLEILRDDMNADDAAAKVACLVEDVSDVTNLAKRIAAGSYTSQNYVADATLLLRELGVAV